MKSFKVPSSFNPNTFCWKRPNLGGGRTGADLFHGTVDDAVEYGQVDDQAGGEQGGPQEEEGHGHRDPDDPAHLERYSD